VAAKPGEFSSSVATRISDCCVAVSVIRPDHSHAENLELQAVIERDYLECGCRQGQIAAVILLLIMALFGFTIRPPLQDQPIENLIMAVALAIIGALLVTLSVILRARFRLLKRLDDLARPGSPPPA
jgi:hypothetical protein